VQPAPDAGVAKSAPKSMLSAREKGLEYVEITMVGQRALSSRLANACASLAVPAGCCWPRESPMKPCYLALVLLLGTIGLAACGKSSEQMAREQEARQVAMQKALADSVAEEHDKDRRMRDAATEQANEGIAREAAAHELEVAAKAAAALEGGPTPEQRQAERDSACGNTRTS
jgi:hypothetical protein